MNVERTVTTCCLKHSKLKFIIMIIDCLSKDTHCYTLTVLFDMVANLNINAFQSPLALNKCNLAPWKIHSKMICYKNMEETEQKENFLFQDEKNILLLVG